MACNLDKNYKCGAGYRNNVYSMEKDVSPVKNFSPDIRVGSAGLRAGNFARFWVDGKRINWRTGRGLNIVAIDSTTGKIMSK